MRSILVAAIAIAAMGKSVSVDTQVTKQERRQQ